MELELGTLRPFHFHSPLLHVHHVDRVEWNWNRKRKNKAKPICQLYGFQYYIMFQAKQASSKFHNKVISQAESWNKDISKLLRSFPRFHSFLFPFFPVYLRTDPEVAYKRIAQRGRSEENSIKLEYLQSVHELHEEWLVRNQKMLPCPVSESLMF